jgi:hypothetical protein
MVLSKRIGLAGHAAIAPSGEIVISAPTHLPDLIGQPIHFFAADGRHIRSFGATTEIYRPDLALSLRRLIAVNSLGELVAVGPTERTARFWRVGESEGSPFELPPDVAVVEPQKRVASLAGQIPVSVVSDVAFDPTGHLWILCRVPDARWRESAADFQSSGGKTEDANRYWDTIIVATMPARRTQRPSIRIDAALLAFADRHTAYAISQSPGGGHTISIWTFSLNDTGGSK